jgi:hypothetical protein
VNPDVEVAKFAEKHRGLITIGAARKAGLTAGDCTYRVASNRWRRLFSGLFIVAGVPETIETRRLAATLATRCPSVASHDTAATVHQLTRAVDRSKVHILVPHPSVVFLDRVVCHRTKVFLLDDFTLVDGLPVTNVARTICDIGGRFNDRLLGRMIDEALRNNSCSIDDIGRTKARLGRAPGRKLTPLDVALANRIEGYDPGDSNLEADTFAVLRRGGLPMPRIGFAITLDGILFHLDLAWPEYRVTVELDGWHYHKGRQAFDDDRQRSNLLAGANWTGFRFTSKTSPEEVLRLLRPVLRTPIPSSLPD